MLSIVSKNNPGARKILYLWNINVNNKKIQAAENLGFEIWTFDIAESKKYQYKYNPQFYPMNRSKADECNKIVYDIFWVGYDKGRKHIIDKLVHEFDNLHLNYKILMRQWDKYGGIFSKKEKRDNKNYEIGYKEYRYSEVLEYVKYSNALLDINVEGQTGITIRVLEALAYNKKLITNNISVKKMDLYNKSNIFILGIDDIINLPDFLALPVEIDDDIKSKYDIHRWISSFIENKLGDAGN